ncbi:MAG: T9SS type A sorting domain-containing protein [Candidatus Cloacimonetes bacterium]|nr:T9SS type A sorting domain-containing protein [Candidatus Cloacimonadota bacterium]
MKTKSFLLFFILMITLPCIGNIMIYENDFYLTDVIQVNLKGLPNEQQLEIFLSDYDMYLSNERYYQCCNLWWFLFRGDLVDREYLAQTLSNDSRVAWVKLENPQPFPSGDFRLFNPRYIGIIFHESASEKNIKDFVEKYSDYGFRGWDWWFCDYKNFDMFFKFNDKQIFAGDFMDILRNDEIVEFVDFYYGWVSGAFPISFQNGVNENAAIEYLLDKYSQYNIEIKIESATPWLKWAVYFDHYVVDEFYLLEKLNQEKNVGGHFQEIYRLLCGDESLNINDNIISPITSTLVYPNPVQNKDANFLLFNYDNQSKFYESQTTISIFNVRGQLVKRSNDFLTKNSYKEFVWDRKDENNRFVPSGVYFFQIKNDLETHTGRFMILK